MFGDDGWWARASHRQKVTAMAFIALVVALLFWFPPTRMIILFVLPLGSGFDDLIFIGALLLTGLFFAFRFFMPRH